MPVQPHAFLTSAGPGTRALRDLRGGLEVRERQLLPVHMQDAGDAGIPARRARIRRGHRDQQVVLRTRRPQEGGEELRQPSRDPRLLAPDRRSRSSPAAIGSCNGPTSERGIDRRNLVACHAELGRGLLELWAGGLDDRGVDVAAGREARDRRAVPTGRVPACAKAVPPADANSIAFADRRRASTFSLSPGTSPTSPIEGWPSAGDGVVTGRSCRAEQVLGLIELTRL